MQKSHDFGFRDSTRLNGKYLIQYRSPIPRLQSNYDLAVTRGTSEQSKESFIAFAERETVYFINFFRKWVAVPRSNAMSLAYEDLIEQQERTLATAIGFIRGDAAIDTASLARTVAQVPVAADTQGRCAIRCSIPIAIRRRSRGSSARWRRLRQGPHPLSFYLASHRRPDHP